MSTTKRRRRKALPSGCYRICFHDEAPRFGCGWRTIHLVKKGPKWCRLREVSTGTVVRLPARIWPVLKPTQIS